MRKSNRDREPPVVNTLLVNAHYAKVEKFIIYIQPQEAKCQVSGGVMDKAIEHN